MNYSVLTTVYKNDKSVFLKQSIDSMLAQTILTNDYVIIEDGPLTKELEEIIEYYTTQYTFFNVVKLPINVGLGQALRIGVTKCKNELIARLDSDDIALPIRCELQLKEFENDSELAILGSDMYEFENTIEVLKDIKKMPSSMEEIYKYGKRRNPFNHSTVMYKKSVILNVGNYSTMRRSQDIELWSKIIFRGYKTKNISKPLIYFRTDGNKRIKRKRKWSNVKSDLKIFWKNYIMGYSSIIDYFYVFVYQIVFFLMPEKMAEILYTRMLRSKA